MISFQTITNGVLMYNTFKTNEHLAEVNQALANLQNMQNEQTSAESIQQAMRDFIYQVREYVSDEVPKLHDAAALFNLYSFRYILNAKGISTTAFSQLGDKEFARQVFKTLDSEIDEREKRLPQAAAAAISNTARIDLSIDTLLQLSRVARIHDLLPGLTIRQKNKGAKWIGLMLGLLVGIAYLIAPVLGALCMLGLIGFMIFQAAQAKATVSSNWPKIQEIANGHVDVSKDSTRENAMAFIAELEAELLAQGEPKSVNYSDYVSRAAEAEKMHKEAITTYRLTSRTDEAIASN
jgi:hypothetical protein